MTRAECAVAKALPSKIDQTTGLDRFHAYEKCVSAVQESCPMLERAATILQSIHDQGAGVGAAQNWGLIREFVKEWNR